jgi:hypothetical protein
MTERPPALLAVDLGLRTGLALYGADGRLRWYRSQNFGSNARLRRGAFGVLKDLPEVEYLVLEGGGALADLWAKEGERRGLRVRVVDAETWRRVLLYPRERRSGTEAKAAADTFARRVIEWSDVARPTSLRHDAAEAILVGLWGVLQAGWLPGLPGPLRR